MMKIRSYTVYLKRNRSHIACIFRNGLVEQTETGEMLQRVHCIVGDPEQVFRYLFNMNIAPVMPAAVLRYKKDAAQVADEMITYDPNYAPELTLTPWKGEALGKYLQDLKDEYDRQLDAGLTEPYATVEDIHYFF